MWHHDVLGFMPDYPAALLFFRLAQIEAAKLMRQSAIAAVFEIRFLAAMSDRIEVERERIGIRKQQRRQLFHPAFQKLNLIVANRLIRILSGITLLRKDVESSKQTERFVAVEVIDMTQPFLVEQLKCQETEQRIHRRYHLRSGVVGCSDNLIKSHLCEERQKEKNPGVPRDESSASFQ